MTGAIVRYFDLDDDGALMFPFSVELLDSDKPAVARRACRMCFPDGRVEYVGFAASPRGTLHIPMPDGATVCCHEMNRPGWWYLL